MRLIYMQIVLDELNKADGLYAVRSTAFESALYNGVIYIQDGKSPFDDIYNIKLCLKYNSTHSISYEWTKKVDDMYVSGKVVAHKIRLSAANFNEFRRLINADETLDSLTKAIILSNAEITTDKMKQFVEVVFAKWHNITF